MGAPDLIEHLRAAGLALSVDGDRLIVKPRDRLTDDTRAQIRAHRDALVRLLSAPAETSSEPGDDAPATSATPAELDPHNAFGWDDAEIEAFSARVRCFEQRGRADAETLAERLVRRDRNGDDRRMCLECTHLGDRGRCLAAAAGRIYGADRRLEPVPDILQRCEAFGLRKGLA